MTRLQERHSRRQADPKRLPILFIRLALITTLGVAGPGFSQQCEDTSSVSTFPRFTPPSPEGTASRDGTLSSTARAGAAEDKQHRVILGAGFRPDPSPDIEIAARIVVESGYIEAWSVPLSGFAEAGASLRLTVAHGSGLNGREISGDIKCTDDLPLDNRSTPAFLTSRNLHRQIHTLTCRYEFGPRPTNVDVYVSLHTWAVAGGGSGASSTVEARVLSITQKRCCADALDAPEGMLPIFSWWSPSREDNFLTTEPAWAGCPGSVRSPDYRFVSHDGFVFDPTRPQPTGTVPLFRWFDLSRGDNFTSTEHRDRGLSGLGLSPSYGRPRTLGFVYDPNRPPTTPSHPLRPMFRWYSPSRGDNFTTTQRAEEGRAGTRISPDYGPPLLVGFALGNRLLPLRPQPPEREIMRPGELLRP
ncbi:MAG: hypothetical protein K0U98_24835 [Deltaproteobacteria bacterium]|nr:hypothetical protein [Deltaproteobacteria bacterium]